MRNRPGAIRVRSAGRGVPVLMMQPRMTMYEFLESLLAVSLCLLVLFSTIGVWVIGWVAIFRWIGL